MKYDVCLSVYTSVSGVVTCLPDGTIHSYNPNFVNTLLGYEHSEQLRHRVREQCGFSGGFE